MLKTVLKMKNKLFFLLSVMALPLFVKAQDTLRFYLDKKWKPTSDYLAYYYRDMYKSDSLWVITDYFHDGQVQMKGASLTLSTDDKQGPFTFYYENGNKQGEGNYNHGKRVGYWKWWYESGSVQVLDNYGEDGTLDGEWKSFYESGQLKGEGNYKNGKFNGLWKWYYKNGKKSALERYKEGTLLSASYWNKDGTPLQNPDAAKREPEYQGGVNGLLKFVKENSAYPKWMKKLGVTGIVYVMFTVKTDGSISDISILRSPNEELSKSVMAAVKKIPPVKPAKCHNLLCDYPVLLPVRFSLSE